MRHATQIVSGLLLPLEQKWPLGTNCLLWSSGVCPPLVHPAGAKRSGSVTAVSVRMLEPALSSTGRCGPGASDGPLQVQPHNVFRMEAQGSKTVMLTSSMSPSSMACNTFGLKVDCHSGMMHLHWHQELAITAPCLLRGFLPVTWKKRGR